MGFLSSILLVSHSVHFNDTSDIATAANGIFGHPLRGMDISISRALKSDSIKAVKYQRMLQGEYEFSAASEQERQSIIENWHIITNRRMEGE